MKIKGFAIVYKNEIQKAHVKMEEGCGYPFTESLGIYTDDLDASMALCDIFGRKGMSIVPVEVTFKEIIQVKKKSKKKSKK